MSLVAAAKELRGSYRTTTKEERQAKKSRALPLPKSIADAAPENSTVICSTKTNKCSVIAKDPRKKGVIPYQLLYITYLTKLTRKKKPSIDPKSAHAAASAFAKGVAAELSNDATFEEKQRFWKKEVDAIIAKDASLADKTIKSKNNWDASSASVDSAVTILNDFVGVAGLKKPNVQAAVRNISASVAKKSKAPGARTRTPGSGNNNASRRPASLSKEEAQRRTKAIRKLDIDDETIDALMDPSTSPADFDEQLNNLGGEEMQDEE